MSRIRIGVAQINPTVGDLDGNAGRILDAAARASTDRCDLLVCPQLALTGLPLGGLLERTDFLKAAGTALETLAGQLPGDAVLVGVPELFRGKVYNSIALLHGGRVVVKYRMGRTAQAASPLPLEAARFSPGRGTNAFSLAGARIEVFFGLSHDESGQGLAVYLPVVPYAVETSRPIPAGTGPSCVCNPVGAQDGLVFYGAGSIRTPGGEVVAGCRTFDEDYCAADIDVEPGDVHGLHEVPTAGAGKPELRMEPLEAMSDYEEIYKALVVGLRDFVHKNGFSAALVGASGGIDSSLVLTIACDALGPDHVTAVSMPSSITSSETKNDAALLAQNLACRFREIGIAQTVASLEESIPAAADHTIARENLQARARGVILMTLANIDSSIVIATGNRSESQTGYCTLYGDTVGGYGAIADVPKTTVYRLAELVNREKNVIPPTVIDRPPSAELSPGQTDQDKLPPYPDLDAILAAILDTKLDSSQIRKAGFDTNTVDQVLSMIRSSEHKRYQAPPATLIHHAAITRFASPPVTNAF